MNGSAITAAKLTPSGSTQPSPRPSNVAAEIGARSVAAFEEIIERLGEIRGVSVDLTKDLDGLAELAGSDGSSAELLPRVRDLLTDFTGTLEANGAQGGEGGVLSNLAVARDYVGRIHRYALTLSAVATMSRTTTASLGIDALRGYFEELTQTATVIGQAASEIGARIEDVRKSVGASGEGMAAARNGLVGILPQVEVGIEKEARLEAEEARAASRVRERAARLSGDAREQIKSFVTAIQFSDRQAQRLEHIEGMLNNADGHVARLAAAQSRALATDMKGIADQIRNTMQALSQFGHDARGLLTEGDVSDAIETNLSNRSEIGTAITAQLAGFRKALNGVRERGEHCARAFDAVGDALGVLERASKSVALAAVNSTIFASRSGDARGPLATLSLEVRDTATRCLAAVGGTQSATNAAITQNRESSSVLIGDGSALDEAVMTYQSETSRGEERFTRLGELRGNAAERVGSLLELSEVIQKVVARVDGSCNALEELADTLDQVSPTGPLDASLLTSIWDGYTMDEERQVHAEVFAGEDDAIPASTLPEENAGNPASIDDLLF